MSIEDDREVEGQGNHKTGQDVYEVRVGEKVLTDEDNYWRSLSEDSSTLTHLCTRRVTTRSLVSNQMIHTSPTFVSICQTLHLQTTTP